MRSCSQIFLASLPYQIHIERKSICLLLRHYQKSSHHPRPQHCFKYPKRLFSRWPLPVICLRSALADFGASLPLPWRNGLPVLSSRANPPHSHFFGFFIEAGMICRTMAD